MDIYIDTNNNYGILEWYLASFITFITSSVPPAVSPCHCTPYLHCIRIFWSAVDMPDLPLLEYRVEHIYWVASSSGGSSTAAVASVDDGLTGAVGNGLPSPSSAPGSSAARVNGYASPNSQGDVPIPGNPTSPPMVADGEWSGSAKT